MGRKRLGQIQDMVLGELTMRPETRSNDRELIMAVYRDYYGIVNDKFSTVMNRADLPSFETIRRTRQKLQEFYEDLRADAETEEKRLNAQVDYIEYAKGEQE